MHKYMRAIGFNDMPNEDLNNLFSYIMEHPTTEKVATDSAGNDFAEFSYEFGGQYGVSLRGTYDKDDYFVLEYYYPYFRGRLLSTQETIDVERHAEKESYAGICDDIRIGITMIFYLQNVIDYLSANTNPSTRKFVDGAILSGLSTEGKVLFPIHKEKRHISNTGRGNAERNCLIEAARDGDEDAIESLTLEDMDMYSLLGRRVEHEDVMTIVETYFMPYGIESDQYDVLGIITNCQLTQNEFTKADVYLLDLLCNEMPISICIRKDDLYGEPEAGRRFKGVVGLQGSIHYRD